VILSPWKYRTTAVRTPSKLNIFYVQQMLAYISMIYIHWVVLVNVSHRINKLNDESDFLTLQAKEFKVRPVHWKWKPNDKCP
jgi:hypothetical protein